jgi:hypothetical protein
MERKPSHGEIFPHARWKFCGAFGKESRTRRSHMDHKAPNL